MGNANTWCDGRFVFVYSIMFVSSYMMLGEFTPSYILHTRAFGTYLLGGVFTLQKKIIR